MYVKSFYVHTIVLYVILSQIKYISHLFPEAFEISEIGLSIEGGGYTSITAVLPEADTSCCGSRELRRQTEGMWDRPLGGNVIL